MSSKHCNSCISHFNSIKHLTVSANLGCQSSLQTRATGRGETTHSVPKAFLYCTQGNCICPAVSLTFVLQGIFGFQGCLSLLLAHVQAKARLLELTVLGKHTSGGSISSLPAHPRGPLTTNSFLRLFTWLLFALLCSLTPLSFQTDFKDKQKGSLRGRSYSD